MYNNYPPAPNPWEKRFQVKIGGCSLIFLGVLAMCILSALASSLH